MADKRRNLLKSSLLMKKLTESHSGSSADTPSLPPTWNSSDTISFRYKHNQSAMQYLVKVNRLGKKAVVFGVGLGDDKTVSFDVAVADYVSESSLPASPVKAKTNEPEESASKTQVEGAGKNAADEPTTKEDNDNMGEGGNDKSSKAEKEETTAESMEQAAKTIQDIFISAGRLSDLGSHIRIKLIQKLIPGLQKEGYEDNSNSSSAATTSTSNEPGRTSQPPHSNPHQPNVPYPHGIHDPLAEPPRARPFPAGEMRPPGFEDEYDILRPAGGHGMPGRPPVNIGERDLYPPGMGPYDPLRPGPGFGGLGSGGMGGGGMHPTFDDPLFRGPGRQGGGEYDPQAPPGARYDPVGPWGGAPRDGRGGSGTGRSPGGGLGGGGGPPNPFGGFGSGDFI